MAETDAQQRYALGQQVPYERELLTQPIVILEYRVFRPREYYPAPAELARVYFFSAFNLELRETR